MISAYIESIRSKSLPLWQSDGFDQKTGLFRERLSLSGQPLAVPHRAMVQARQIYVYAHASLLGWNTAGLEKAVRAMRQTRELLAESRDGKISFAFAVDPAGGTIHSHDRDSYTHAFMLFAAAYLYRATQDPELVDLIDGLTRYVDEHLFDPVHDGVFDRLPHQVPAIKRQNPQMHLLEAYIALHEALPDRGYLARIDRLLSLFRTRLFDRERSVLLEHFAGDWGLHHDSTMADLVEPGHHYEWAWLLAQGERLSGQDLAAERTALFASAQASGHAVSGLIFDEIAGDGQTVSASHRLWPHTEAIKAGAMLFQAGRPEMRGFCDHMAGLLQTHFLGEPFEGGWIDHRHADLAPRVDYVPASSLYHLFLAAAEGHAAFGEDCAEVLSGVSEGMRSQHPISA